MSRAANDMLETATHDRPNGSVCERFRSIAKRYPDHVAVCDESSRLSYTELDDRSDRVASALIDRGIGHEEPVALAIPKSCDQIVALLGILKAGGAYVPIVANQPESRLRSMLHDAGVRFAITQPGYLDELWGEGIEPLCVTQLCAESHQGLLPELDGSSLAYIMYTSGSTGVPKGVLIEHAGIIRLVCGQSYLPFGPELTYLYAAPLSFDVSTLEIFTPLLHGAKCVIAPEGMPDADRIASLTDREQVRSCCLAFGLFRTLFEANPSIFDPMSHIAVGGERVEPRVIAAAQDRLPHAKFVNAYGPTEATMLATTYTLNERVDEAQEHIPIGAALQGVTTHVLDEELRPVSQGDPGELCLGGIGIARGYINRPELTDDRFVTLVHDGRAERIYRTGDRVIMDDQHQLIFLGRMDAQIKLRGHRIELGEIEQCAMRLGWVFGAVACVIETDGSSRIGLLIKVGSITPDLDVLQTHLRSNLPGAMVPELIGAHDELPLNRNGKIDRALAAELILAGKLEHDADREEGELPLTTETQRGLAGLMSEVLGVPVGAASDRFLHLGGHSLRAVVLCSRIRQRFGVGLPISRIYALGTVSGIAAEIDTARGGSQQQDRIEIGRSIDDSPAPLSLNQQRLWMLDRIHPNDPSYIVTIRLEQDGQLDRSAFSQAWQMLCDRQDILRTRIVIVNGEPMQIIDRAMPIEPEYTGAGSVAPEELDSIIEHESARGFDLLAGPLVRCRVYDTGDRASVHITMHHIISDAWSCSVLQRELAEIYRACLQSRPATLPELPIRYRDYARWEETLRDRPGYQHALSEWVEMLRDAPVLRLPADHPAVDSSSSTGLRVEHRLDPVTHSQIQKAAQSLGVTPFAYMLAIFKVWLYRLTLEDDVVVGVPIANRDRQETEELIGFFMETLALRDRIDPKIRLDNQIQSIASNALRAFDRREVPFQDIVGSLGLQGQHDRNPLFEVFFNYITTPMTAIAGNRMLDFSEHEIDNHTAKFDLTCYVFDDPDHPRIIFNARRGRFSSKTIQWYLTQYTRLLASSIEHLGKPLNLLPLDLTPISPPHPARVPAPQLPPEVPVRGSIPDQIEQAVRSHPRRIAIRSNTGTLRYQELWSQSGSVAHQLQRHGLKPGDRVGVHLNEPVQTCIATLAVLRCGACFIPTDKLWPTQRLEQIMAISGCELLLADTTAGLEWFDGRVLVPQAIPEESTAPPEPIDPGLPAYIMFTSGSTGTPKGVVQTHHAVVGHMRTFAHAIALEPGAQLLQLSSFAFDAAIMDMFACWFTGATLCVQDPRSSSPTSIASWINEHNIDAIHAAPTLLRWLLAQLDEHVAMPCISRVILGGEHASDHDLDAIVSCFPNCERFINGLGLTESSLTLQYRIDPRVFEDPPSRLPVGYPVEGVRLRLIDRQGNPCGPTGQIEIQSDRIAMSYITGRDDQPSQIGITDPETALTRFGTGDLGTIRHDGSIMHMGRMDDQVSIRGCRVEPSEVEQALRSLDLLEDAAIRVESQETGEQALTALVVCGDECTQESIQYQLACVLPAYMIPQQWLRVVAIPRVGGGKIDRRSLLQIEPLSFPDQRAPKLGSIDHQTRAVMRAFERVLEIEGIGPDDHFFRMGGNSLRAIQLFTALREVFDQDLPISVIFRAPTPRDLRSEFARQSSVPPDGAGLITLREGSQGHPFVVFPGIGGHPLGFGPLIERVQPSRAVTGVQYPNESTLDHIGRSLPELAKWVIDRLQLDPNSKIPDLIGYSFGGSLSLEIAMRLAQAGHTPGRLILLDAHLPFGLPRKGHLGKAWAHFARIVEGQEQSRLSYITDRLRPKVSSDEKPTQGSDPAHPDLAAYRAVSRINRQMVIDYQPAAHYHAPVLLIRAKQPEWLRFHRDDGFNGFSSVIDPSLITRAEIDANHLDLFKVGTVEQIAAMVDHWLNSEHA